MSLVPAGYKPRILDELIARRLAEFGAVKVTGAKCCGKTWSSLAQGKASST